jgi:hypothetical protein
MWRHVGAQLLQPPSSQSKTMENEKPRIRIELTEDQKQKIKQASGEEISVIEFTMQELEERIAPVLHFKY